MIKLVRDHVVVETYRKANILTDGEDVFIELNSEDRVMRE